LRGFLLDTNHLGAYFRKEPAFMQKLGSYPLDWQVRVCTITIGETEAGHIINRTTDQQRRNDFNKFLREKFLDLELCVSLQTAPYYAKIVAGILQALRQPSPGTRTERHLVLNGVDINDVWITAAAWEHNLTLVTQDNMRCIKDAVGPDSARALSGDDYVRFDCWLEQHS